MDDKALRSWVSDQLFALLGFAESSLVGFIVALGACTGPPVATHSGERRSPCSLRGRLCACLPLCALSSLRRLVVRNPQPRRLPALAPWPRSWLSRRVLSHVLHNEGSH